MERDHVLLGRARSALWGRITEWRSRLPTELDTTGDLVDVEDPLSYPEDEQILLPSSLPPDDCPSDLGNLELRLRWGQANDSLKTIRTCLSQRLVLLRDKRLNARGQESNTRANSTIGRFNIQIAQAAAQYRQAYRAMRTLGMEENMVYQELKEVDLSTSNVFDPHRPVGRGNDAGPSWIWRNNAAQLGNSPDANLLEEGECIHIYLFRNSDMILVMRVQFLDVKVNHDRWQEEVELLEAEIKRTIDYFKHFAEEWRKFSKQDTSHGRAAYGRRMANVYDRLAQQVGVSSPDDESLNGMTGPLAT
jgi:hypothetical protein